MSPPSCAALGGAQLTLRPIPTTTAPFAARRASTLESQITQLYSNAFPEQGQPNNPVATMGQAVAAARDRADFLGVYGGNHSALDLLAELSRRVPDDLEVKFEEVSIDPRVIRIKVFAKDFEAPARSPSLRLAPTTFWRRRPR